MLKTALLTLFAVCSLTAYADDTKTETKKTIESFPTIFSEMEKAVGAKDSVDVFIPKTSYLNLTLFDTVPTTESEVNFPPINTKRVGSSRSNYDLKDHINKVVQMENGKLVTINLKGLEHQTLRIAEDMTDNKFITEYDLIDGYVLSSRLILSQYKFDDTYGQVKQELDYLESRYNNFLGDKHYGKEFFNKGYVNHDSQKYVIIEQNINPTNVIATISLKVTTKDIEENYSKITEPKPVTVVDKKESIKDLDERYKILNNILK